MEFLKPCIVSRAPAIPQTWFHLRAVHFNFPIQYSIFLNSLDSLKANALMKVNVLIMIYNSKYIYGFLNNPLN